MTGTTIVEKSTLKVGNAVVEALLEAGAGHDSAANTFWGMHYFLLGLVQEEESEQSSAPADLARRIAGGEFPALLILQEELTAPSFTARFDFGIAAFLHAALHA